jgi:hypothetical protein
MGAAKRARSRDTASISPLGWVVALLGPCAVSLALVPLRTEIRASNASLVLVVVVVAAAVLGGRAGGAVAAVTGAVSFDFFFTHPYNSFTINSRDDVETTLLLLVVGMVVGELVVRTRRSERAAAESRREVGEIRDLAELAAGGESPGELVLIVRRRLADLLELERCRFERPPFATQLPRLAHGRVQLPGERPGGDGFAPSYEVELPVWGDGRLLGRFVLELSSGTTGITIPSESRRTAVALADRLGALLANAPHC